MSLILKLAPGEKLFINGAVVTNGDRRAYLMLETKAQIVREKDVLPAEDASTPVRRAYFAAQGVLLHAQPVLGRTDAFAEQIARLRGAFLKPEHISLLDEAEGQMQAGNTYRALSALRELVMYEAALLDLDPPERFRREGTAREQAMPSRRGVMSEAARAP
ncbi:flagellar biosynthesis repressor FlbT [Roseomonas marmotae]|uniref:Flagellar biosynthesis repressor FlbT n=1 Tax=Roseomonas marmotae TaxID=2768161 RepID=A0ABS3KF91_9PROT|nr:flagellar biosynthesis repressor FlbT [Roseomonas marmotae]MBO1076136.1 flagellar biosynthesis repressor FlbT [Roseomonas marmotae]QTI81269.1 flagellar biosynthesis repressor FlbT [Roseomonas marmotae]